MELAGKQNKTIPLTTMERKDPMAPISSLYVGSYDEDPESTEIRTGFLKQNLTKRLWFPSFPVFNT